MQTLALNETTASLRRILFAAELPAARNETQTVDVAAIAATHSFTLTYGGQTTAAILFSADMAADIDTKLEALSTIGAGNVTVTKGATHIYTVTFIGTLAATDVALLTITATGFVAGPVTETAHGGVAGAPARLLTITPSQLLVSKNGAAAATSLGTVTEIGNGRYYYEATEAELNTPGFLSLALVRTDVALVYPTVEVKAASTVDGGAIIRSATATAGASASITLDAAASAVSNFYVPSLVFLVSGTGALQARLAHAYDGATKVLSVEPAWTTLPAAGTVFKLYAVSPLMVDAPRINHAVIDTFGDVATAGDIADAVVPRIISDEIAFPGAKVTSIDTRIPTALVSGRMSADAVAISGSTTAADVLEAHAGAVVRVEVDTGSTATSVLLKLAPTGGVPAPSSANSTYNGRVLIFLTGALAFQAQTISDYVGATRVLTTSAFTAAPADGDLAIIV